MKKPKILAIVLPIAAALIPSLASAQNMSCITNADGPDECGRAMVACCDSTFPDGWSSTYYGDWGDTYCACYSEWPDRPAPNPPGDEPVC